MVTLIAYDLHTKPRDYSKVVDTIKSAGSYAHLEESVWLVNSSLSTNEWRDKLKEADDDATYFVVRLAHDWASSKTNPAITTWLKSGLNW